MKVQEKISKKKNPSSAFTATNQTLAEFFNVSTKTICEWVKNGMPKEKYATYDLKKCFDWWLETIEATKEDANPKLVELRAEGQKIKNQREQIKLDTERGLLISKEEVVDQWCKRIAVVKQSLLSLAVRLPPVVEGKSRQEIRSLVNDEAVRILEDYSRPGRHCSARKKGKK